MQCIISVISTLWSIFARFQCGTYIRNPVYSKTRRSSERTHLVSQVGIFQHQPCDRHLGGVKCVVPSSALRWLNFLLFGIKGTDGWIHGHLNATSELYNLSIFIPLHFVNLPLQSLDSFGFEGIFRCALTIFPSGVI